MLDFRFTICMLVFLPAKRKREVIILMIFFIRISRQLYLQADDIYQLVSKNKLVPLLLDETQTEHFAMCLNEWFILALLHAGGSATYISCLSTLVFMFSQREASNSISDVYSAVSYNTSSQRNIELPLFKTIACTEEYNYLQRGYGESAASYLQRSILEIDGFMFVM